MFDMDLGFQRMHVRERAEARAGGEIVVDEGDGAQRIAAFLEQLKVV